MELLVCNQRTLTIHCKIVKRFKRALLRVCCRSLWAWTKASKEGTGMGPWYALKAWRAVDTCFAESTHLRVRAARVVDNGTMPLLVLMLLKFGDVNPSKLCRTSSARRASSSGERPCKNVYTYNSCWGPCFPTGSKDFLRQCTCGVAI